MNAIYAETKQFNYRNVLFGCDCFFNHIFYNQITNLDTFEN